LKKGIAFFDFDGTITKKDSLLEFIRFCKGKLSFIVGFLLNMHYLLGYKLKLISNQKAKERILGYFFNKMPLHVFEDCCRRFNEERLPYLIRPGALKEIKSLKDKGYIIVIVSASPENWIRDWAKQNDLEMISSILEIQNGKLTGKICGKNCHGQEKVRRILEKYHITDFDEILAYGDSYGDRPMLDLASTSFYRPFRS
jgi:HAD superfamily hydrolase (TIGR01490 family)